MRRTLTLLLCALVLVLPGCSALLDERQREYATRRTNELEQQGSLTSGEAAAVREFITKDITDQSELERILYSLGSVGLSLFGVYAWRGSPNARKGKPPTST